MAPGITRATAHRVMGMVMLKQNTASVPGRGRADSRYSAAASPRERLEARTAPILSARKPPAHFPSTRAVVRARAQCPVLFQENAWFIPM